MTEAGSAGILDRALANLRATWRGITVSDRAAKALPLRPGLPGDDADALRRQMRECLEGRGGEVSARARAAALGHAYLTLDKDGRRRFLTILAGEFGVDRDALRATARALADAEDPADVEALESDLRRVLTPPRLTLLTQFNSLPRGVKFLVDLRADLKDVAKGRAELRGLDDDLRGLLTSWFDVGFLDLRRITWDAPAALLEKLIAYEAVHEIRSWDDLKHRLDSDRRCYAYFHPSMPDEPLIFVQVALVTGMSAGIQTLLDETAPTTDPTAADTAVFYSISNTQRGLQGVGFGSFLIKRVVDDLAKDLPGLKTFATLSPIPGFRRHLTGLLEEGEHGRLAPGDRRELAAACGGDDGLKAVLSATDWHFDEALAQALKGPLMRLCARYLAQAKRADRALDPVAHFHLSNGARVERLNWLGDVSAKGMSRSLGLMVNYLYKLRDIERNHEAYTASGRAVTSAAVRALLAGQG